MLSHQAILERLVGFQTVSDRSNKDLIQWVASYLTDLGAVIRILPGEGQCENLWASFGSSSETQSGLVFAGHSDVVPVEGQKWDTDPFILTENDGNLYGRGACDMKGFIACALHVAAVAKEKGDMKPFHIALTYDEEVDMKGASQMAQWIHDERINAEWVWIGEPTMMRIVSAHKGVASSRTEVTGRAAHSSMPYLGANALYPSADLIGWIRGQAEKRAASPIAGSRFVPPYTTFNVGVIHGGKAMNIIAEQAVIDWEYRLHPGDVEDDIWESYRAFEAEKLTPQVSSVPEGSIKTVCNFRIPPFDGTGANKGVEVLCPLLGQGEADVVSFATEAGYFQQAGIPSVVCGPGNISCAHQPNEHVAVTQLDRCVETMIKALS